MFRLARKYNVFVTIFDFSPAALTPIINIWFGIIPVIKFKIWKTDPVIHIGLLNVRIFLVSERQSYISLFFIVTPPYGGGNIPIYLIFMFCPILEPAVENAWCLDWQLI